LTQILSKILLPESWLAKWDLVKSPLFSADGTESEYCELVCTDNKSIRVGRPVHKETYGFLSNADFLAIVRDSMELIPGAIVESLGSVCARGRIFVGISVPEVKELKAAGRVFYPYLNFLSSHDMSAPFLVNMSTVCPVCDNTFRANLHDTENKAFRVIIPHTKNAKMAVANVPRLVDCYCGTAAKFAAIMDSMANESVSTSQAERFFAGFLAAKDDNEANRIVTTRADGIKISTRAENQRNRLVELFVSGKGNRGNDRSDLFGAITDYYSHESSGGRDVWKQIASSEFGSGQTSKDRAYGILQNNDRTDLMIRAGDALLV